MHKVHRSRCAAIGELPVVSHEEVDEENLHFVRGEKASRACMHAVSEAEMFRAGSHELESVLVAGFLTLLVESEAIVRLRIRVESFVLHVVRRNCYAGALGDAGAVGQHDISHSEAVEEGCTCMSEESLLRL